MTAGRREVTRLRSRLDAAFARVSDVGVDALEARADFARYLCVLVSGYLEKAVSELLFDYCRQQAGPRIQRYVRHRLERFQNPSKGNISALLDSFDPRWSRELDAYIVDERAAALGSIVNERHRIAHGENSTISYARVQEYRAQIDDVVDFISDLVDPLDKTNQRADDGS